MEYIYIIASLAVLFFIFKLLKGAVSFIFSLVFIFLATVIFCRFFLG